MLHTEDYRLGPGAKHYVSEADRPLAESLREAVFCDHIAEARAMLVAMESGYFKKMILNSVGYCAGIDKRTIEFDSEGNSLLALSKSLEMAELLLAEGADVFITNNRSEIAGETMARLGVDHAASAYVKEIYIIKNEQLWSELKAEFPDLPEVMQLLSEITGWSLPELLPRRVSDPSLPAPVSG